MKCIFQVVCSSGNRMISGQSKSRGYNWKPGWIFTKNSTWFLYWEELLRRTMFIPRDLQHFHYEEIMLGSSHGCTTKKKLSDTMTKELKLGTMRQREFLKLPCLGDCVIAKQMKPKMKSKIKVNQWRELTWAAVSASPPHLQLLGHLRTAKSWIHRAEKKYVPSRMADSNRNSSPQGVEPEQALFLNITTI